jgi:hypothetical protein
MLALARLFGNKSLEFPRIPKPVYFDILGLTVLQYPVTWAIDFFIGLTILFIVTALLGIKRECLTFRGIGLGAAVILLSLLTVPLLLAIIQLAIIQPAMLVNTGLTSSLIGDSLLSNSIRWGSAILTFVTTFIYFALFSRTPKIKKYDFTFAAYSILFFCAAITTFGYPALSYLFTWPLLAGLMAMFSSKGTTEHLGWLQHLGYLGAGMIAIVLFVPGILIALLSVDIREIYLVPVSVVVLLCFLVPFF